MWLVAFFSAFLLLASCSGTKPSASLNAPVANDADAKVKSPRYPVKMDSAELLRLEIAHGSFLRALALESKEEYNLAEQFMQHAYEADPENRFLAFSLIELMEMRGASGDAVKLAEKAKNLKGEKTSSQYALLGRIYGEESNLDSALVYYKKAVEANEQNLHAAYEYALLLEIAHDKDELVKIYAILLPQIGYPQSMLDRQISLLAASRQDSALAALFHSAYEANGDRSYLENDIRLLFGMKRFEEALKAIEEFRADSAFADDSLSISFLSNAYGELHLDSVAVDTLKACYKRHPKDEFLLSRLAWFEVRTGQNESAKAHWHRLSGSPKYDAMAFAMLSDLDLRSGDTLSALGHMEKAYAKNPGLYEFSLASFYTMVGNIGKASAVYDSALAPSAARDSLRVLVQETGDLEKLRAFDAAVLAERQKIENRYGTSLLLFVEMFGRPASKDRISSDSVLAIRKKAELHFAEATRLGDHSADALFSRAANLISLGQLDFAIVLYKKIFADYPGDAMAKNYLGYCLVDLNRNPKELEWGASLIDEALRLDPDNYAYRDSKGWALYRQGKYPEALRVMDDVLKSVDSASIELTGDTSIYMHLADICYALSLSERALGYYRKVLEIDPVNDHAKKQVELLGRPSSKKASGTAL